MTKKGISLEELQKVMSDQTKPLESSLGALGDLSGKVSAPVGVLAMDDE